LGQKAAALAGSHHRVDVLDQLVGEHDMCAFGNHDSELADACQKR
jgi:hypothetical protein